MVNKAVELVPHFNGDYMEQVDDEKRALMVRKAKLFESKSSELARLLTGKAEEYGPIGSFEKSTDVFLCLYPNGVRPDQMSDFLTLVRIVDKLFRIANHTAGDLEDPYSDIAGYCILTLIKDSFMESK